MKRRAIFGLCMLCAFAISAVAAQGAFAAGQTAFTCGAGLGEKDFKDAHCKEHVTAGTGSFGHQAIPVGTVTKITGSNILTGTERATTKLKSVQAGVELELQSSELEGSGTMENVEEGGEMFARGEGTILYKKVVVTEPEGQGCVVKTGEVKTNSLKASTKGLTNELKFTPAAGETAAFAEFTIEGCSIKALNHLYTAKGSVKGQTVGATTNFTHANTTAQKTLTLSGQLAGIEGTLTIKGENGNGLALT